LEYREAFNLDTSDLRGKGVGVQEENQIIVHGMYNEILYERR